MKLESPSFTRQQVDAFRAELMEHDRDLLVKRLEAAGARLREQIGRVVAGEGTEDGDWNAHEVLAHVAVLSKFYGVAAKRIADGSWEEFDLLAFVSQRDVAGSEAARMPVAELAAAIEKDHGRTLEFLRAVDPRELYRRAAIGEGESMSAEEVIRLALCAHLELHLAQLEAAL
jgi:hypothetical protein